MATTAPVAEAAPKPKPACQAITDDKGDTFAIRGQDSLGAFGPQEDALDIVSADLASNGKVVTAVVRVAALSRAIATSPTGFTAGIDFIIGSSPDVVRLSAVAGTGGTDPFEVSQRPATRCPTRRRPSWAR